MATRTARKGTGSPNTTKEVTLNKGRSKTVAELMPPVEAAINPEPEQLLPTKTDFGPTVWDIRKLGTILPQLRLTAAHALKEGKALTVNRPTIKLFIEGADIVLGDNIGAGGTISAIAFAEKPNRLPSAMAWFIEHLGTITQNSKFGGAWEQDKWRRISLFLDTSGKCSWESCTYTTALDTDPNQKRDKNYDWVESRGNLVKSGDFNARPVGMRRDKMPKFNG